MGSGGSQREVPGASAPLVTSARCVQRSLAATRRASDPKGPLPPSRRSLELVAATRRSALRVDRKERPQLPVAPTPNPAPGEAGLPLPPPRVSEQGMHPTPIPHSATLKTSSVPNSLPLLPLPNSPPSPPCLRDLPLLSWRPLPGALRAATEHRWNGLSTAFARCFRTHTALLPSLRCNPSNAPRSCSQPGDNTTTIHGSPKHAAPRASAPSKACAQLRFD